MMVVLPRGVRVARTFWGRARGLLGRRVLDPDEGLLLVQCAAIHTCFMRFPIDVVFVDPEGRVLAVREAVPPWRLRVGARGARMVLELAAGRARELGLRPGVRVVLGEG